MNDGRGGPTYINTRQQLEAHRQVLVTHQGVLQAHASLIERNFWGRLRWLFLGK